VNYKELTIGLDKEILICLNNQNKMTSVVANRNGMFKTPNGCGINMNSISKAT
jgi:3-hydroxyisobutyrate dehydrogenase-like beta-hydroxyacid dehydrogenase